MAEFDGAQYGKDALIEQLLLIENHAKDGSAAKAHCSCIQDKHMRTVIALAKEEIPLVPEKEQKFFERLADWSEKRLQSIYNHVKSNPSDEKEASFYNQLAVDVRQWRLELSEETQKVPCGCIGCVACGKTQ